MFRFLEQYELYFFFFKQKTAYEMRISDWSSDVCSSDLQRKIIGWCVDAVIEQRLGKIQRGDAVRLFLRLHGHDEFVAGAALRIGQGEACFGKPFGEVVGIPGDRKRAAWGKSV